jgi:hypothetical protein
MQKYSSLFLFLLLICLTGKAVGGDFLCAAVSPQGKWVYCVGEDGVCYVFDSSTGQLESVLQVADREVLLCVCMCVCVCVCVCECVCVCVCVCVCLCLSIYVYLFFFLPLLCTKFIVGVVLYSLNLLALFCLNLPYLFTHSLS